MFGMIFVAASIKDVAWQPPRMGEHRPEAIPAYLLENAGPALARVYAKAKLRGKGRLAAAAVKSYERVLHHVLLRRIACVC